MPALPEAFTQPEFPEISATEAFGEATLVFFDHFDFPTAEQLAIADQLDGWSLIRWGGWNDTIDVDDVDLEELASYADEVPDDDAPSLTGLSLNDDGLPNGEREPQPTINSQDIDELYPEAEGWGLIAISTPSPQAIATLAWQGCINVAEPHEMATAVEQWNQRFGVEVLAFGAEEDSDTLLLRIPDHSSTDEDLLQALATAADQVNLYHDPDLGQLASLWFD